MWDRKIFVHDSEVGNLLSLDLRRYCGGRKWQVMQLFLRENQALQQPKRIKCKRGAVVGDRLLSASGDADEMWVARRGME